MITRRQFVQSALLASAAGAVSVETLWARKKQPKSPKKSSPAQKQCFVVVLHGLFVIDVFDPQQLCIMSPDPVTLGHICKAGSWSLSQSAYRDVDPKQTHSTSWNTGLACPTLDPKVFPIVHVQPTHPASTLCIKLPYPKEFQAYRVAPELDYGAFKGAFPLGVGLHYPPEAPPPALIANVPVDPSKNFHIFVELPTKPNLTQLQQHVAMVIPAVKNMFPAGQQPPLVAPPLQPVSSSCKDDQCIKAKEDYAWPELKDDPCTKRQPSIHPVLCMSMFAAP